MEVEVGIGFGVERGENRRQGKREREREARLPLVFGVLASMVFLGEEGEELRK